MTDVPELMRVGREQVANRYILGSGIEIGAGNSPIRLASSVKVKYVDFTTKDMLVNVYGAAADWTDPDIVDDGEILSSIDDDSLDFIIACHVLEHAQNPLRVIQNWFAKLRRGGIAFIVIPDRRHSFDRDRLLTTFDHLLCDYANGPDTSLDDHLHEWVTTVDKVDDPTKVAAQTAELKRIDYKIHYHVWDTTSFIEMLARANGYFAQFDIEHCEVNHMEAVTVLRKR